MGLAPYLHLPQGALSSRVVVTNVSQSVTCQISKYCYHSDTKGAVLLYSFLFDSSSEYRFTKKNSDAIYLLITNSVTFNHKNIQIFKKIIRIHINIRRYTYYKNKEYKKAFKIKKNIDVYILKKKFQIKPTKKSNKNDILMKINRISDKIQKFYSISSIYYSCLLLVN